MVSYIPKKGTRTMLQRPELDEVGRFLLASADRMERYGYWSPSMGERGNRVCAVYAMLDEAVGQNKNIIYTMAYDRLRQHLGVPIMAWSDSHRKEEVIAGIREAAYSSF